MVKRLFIASDLHGSIDAHARFTDFAKNNGGDLIIYCGDLADKHFNTWDLDATLKQDPEAWHLIRTAMGWLAPGEDPPTGLTRDNIGARLQELANRQSVKDFILRRRQTNGMWISQFRQILEASNLPYLAIDGNYDEEVEINAYLGDNGICKRSREIDGIKFTGYGGADASPGHINLLTLLGEIQPYDSSDLETLLTAENPDIVVGHNPPYGFCDDLHNGKHVGDKNARKYLDKGILGFHKLPKVYLCGHIHGAGPGRIVDGKDVAGNPNQCFGVRRIGTPQRQVVVINPGNLGPHGRYAMPELLPMHQLDPQRHAHGFGTFVALDIKDDATPIHITQYTMEPEPKGHYKLGYIGPVRKLREFPIG